MRRICPRCESIFYICLPCDRWHWHCSTVCSLAARQISVRAARQKYGRSKKGRRTNCRAQNTYRKNQRLKQKVSHQSSEAEPKEILLPLEGLAQSQEGGGFDSQQSQLSEEAINERNDGVTTLLRGKRPVCSVCGQTITHIRPQGALWNIKRKICEKEVANDHHSTNTS
jgi:hypothetical protein